MITANDMRELTSMANHFKANNAALDLVPTVLRKARPGDAVTFTTAQGDTVTKTFGSCVFSRRGSRVLSVGVRFTDRSIVALDQMTDISVAAPSLPQCESFVGTGGRCESCRIRKALHA
jgi:hypothetical protein